MMVNGETATLSRWSRSRRSAWSLEEPSARLPTIFYFVFEISRAWFLFRRGKISQSRARELISHQVYCWTMTLYRIDILEMNISDLWPLVTTDHWPGTIWLLKEHKLCVEELQKLKSMIEDLHRCSTRSGCFFLSSIARIDHICFRYIDLIHERGQSLFNAYNDLRKRLMDVRNWAKMENIIYNIIYI